MQVSIAVCTSTATNLAPISAGTRPSGPFETIRVTREGRPIEMFLTISPLTDSRGRILGASTIARDVTERRRGEEGEPGRGSPLGDALGERIRS